MIRDNFLITQRGETNIILSAPHCGSIRSENFPDRTWGVLVRDTYTKSILKGLLNYFPGKQYFIYSALHRSKLDLNRPIHEATQGNQKAEVIWYRWHHTLADYLNDASKNSKALYVDIHSHNNSDEIQIGYCLSKFALLSIMEGLQINTVSSIDGLGHGRYEMMFGEDSMNSVLQKLGRKVYVPTSPTSYFDGGYDVQRHQKKGVGSIQLEIPVSVCEKDLEGLIQDLGFALSHFKERFVDSGNQSNSAERRQ